MKEEAPRQTGSLHDPDWNLNGLISAVPAGCLARWRAEGQAVELHLGQTLHEPGSSPSFVYFPVDAAVALMSVLSTGAALSAAIVGPEGLVGLPVILSEARSDMRAVVQSAGIALRVPVQAVQREFDASAVVRQALQRFTQALVVQMAHSALCTRYHRPDQQLRRWLLQVLDRVPGQAVMTTHEVLAGMLGLRRETVTEACGRLHERSLINVRRGRIEVIDRSGLERDACECYWVARDEYVRLLARRGAARPGS